MYIPQLSDPKASQCPHRPKSAFLCNAFTLGHAATWILVLNLSDENYMNRHMTESIGQLSLIKSGTDRKTAHSPVNQGGDVSIRSNSVGTSAAKWQSGTAKT